MHRSVVYTLVAKIEKKFIGEKSKRIEVCHYSLPDGIKDQVSGFAYNFQYFHSKMKDWNND